MKSKNIPSAIFYKKLFSDLEIYSDLNNNIFHVSKDISKRIFSIPMHPYLKEAEINKITDTINEFYG